MSFFNELKRRNVFRVAIAYVIAAWLVAQVADLVLENIGAPDWVIQTLFLGLGLGLVAALVIAWAYEVTPQGIKRERDVVRDDSVTQLTAKKLDYITLAAALAVVGLIVWQQMKPAAVVPGPSVDTNQAQEGSGTPPGVTTTLAKLGAQSIAVLPFANRSTLDDDLFFTDGIHDDLLTQLAKIRDLKVISRTSVMEYRGTTKKIPEIARELGVATVLEGGVQRAGQRIRINAQLIDVTTDEHLWAETFDREMTIDNLFEIQSEITRQIVTAVKGELTSEEQQALATAPTQSVAAYEAYLHAREVLRRASYNQDEYEAAQPYVEQALALDPDFALAHLMLASFHGLAYWIGYDETPQRQQAARAALDRAATLLSPDAPELLSAQGEYLYRFEQDYPAALNVLLKAQAKIPGDGETRHQIGLTQRRLGLWEDAVTSLLSVAELDPAETNARSTAAGTLVNMKQWGRLEELLRPVSGSTSDQTDLATHKAMLPLRSKGDVNTARQRHRIIRPNAALTYVIATIELPWFDRDYAAVIEVWDRPEVLTLSSNSGFAGYRELDLAMAHKKMGNSEQAGQLLVEVVRRLTTIERTGRAQPVAADLGTLAKALALQGEKARAIAIAEEATRIFPLESDRTEGTWPLKELCMVLALTGERDRALELVAQLIDMPAGFIRWEIYLDPRWDFFRDDERFNELIRPGNFEQSIHAGAGGST